MRTYTQYILPHLQINKEKVPWENEPKTWSETSQKNKSEQLNIQKGVWPYWSSGKHWTEVRVSYHFKSTDWQENGKSDSFRLGEDVKQQNIHTLLVRALLVQLFGEIHTIFWPSNSTSKYIPFGNIHTWTVLAHLLTSQKEKQTYIIRRINKLWSVHSMEYQTAQKMKTDGSYNAEWKMIKKNSCNPTHLYKM